MKNRREYAVLVGFVLNLCLCFYPQALRGQTHTIDRVESLDKKANNIVSPILYVGLGYNAGLRVGCGLDLYNVIRLGGALGMGNEMLLYFFGGDRQYTYSAFIETNSFINTKVGIGTTYLHIYKPQYGNNDKYFIAGYLYYSAMQKKQADLRICAGYNVFIGANPPTLEQISKSTLYVDIKLSYLINL